MKNTKKKNNVPRNLSLVKFDYDNVPKEDHHYYPFIKDMSYLFLGEIPNMPGHCVLIGKNEKHYIGYHIEDFIELTVDEI